jgi:hypothetical protein
MDPEPAEWFRTQDSGLRTQDSGLRTQDSGLRVQDSGFRTQGSGYATGEIMVFCGVSGLKNVSEEKN